MSLLEDIQNSAVEESSDLGTILRKCKILAARLNSEKLENWLIWESNGYPDVVQVPDYRIWPLEVKGHFFGPFGSGIKNAPIPQVCLPEKIRDSYKRYECRLSITTVEETLKEKKSGTVQVSTGDLALALGSNIYENQNCAQAWAEFSINNLVELRNAVRNRILDFALAIWKYNPTAGELNSNPDTQIDSSKITQIFNTTVYGGAANLIGTAHDSSIVFNISPNDFNSLEVALREHGLEDSDIVELSKALKADAPPRRKRINLGQKFHRG